MKSIKSLSLSFLLALAIVSSAFAEQYPYGGYPNQPVYTPPPAQPQIQPQQPRQAVGKADPDGVDIMADIGLRFVGLLGTLVGTALYIGVSPFTAISQLQPPHNSFQKLGEVMVIHPGKYTFTRPIGEFSYPTEGRY